MEHSNRVMNAVFRNIGMSIAPAIGGVLETTYSSNVIGGCTPFNIGELPVFPATVAFPSIRAYNIIFIEEIGFLDLAILFVFMMNNIIVGKRS